MSEIEASLETKGLGTPTVATPKTFVSVSITKRRDSSNLLHRSDCHRRFHTPFVVLFPFCSFVCPITATDSLSAKHLSDKDEGDRETLTRDLRSLNQTVSGLVQLNRFLPVRFPEPFFFKNRCYRSGVRRENEEESASFGGLKSMETEEENCFRLACQKMERTDDGKDGLLLNLRVEPENDFRFETVNRKQNDKGIQSALSLAVRNGKKKKGEDIRWRLEDRCVDDVKLTEKEER